MNKEHAATEEPKTEAQSETTQLLQLDAAERIVTFKDGEHKYRHVFRRITRKDADTFFGAFTVEREHGKRGITERVDYRTPALTLYSNCIKSAEGYAVQGGGNLTDVEDWKQLIPYRHRIIAADLLMSVSEDRGDSQIVIEPGVQRIVLNALWSENASGQMEQCKGLVHRFTPPTAEHERKFNRRTSSAIVVGGSRKGKTIFPSNEAVLVGFYDELIQGVEGYAAGDAPLDSVEEIRSEMDPFHKTTAVAALFDRRIDDDLNDEENDES